MIHYLWIKSIKKEIGLYMKGRKIISVRIAYRYRKSLYQTIQYHKKADTWQSARYLLEFARKAAGMGAGGYMASCHVAMEYRMRLHRQ